MNDTGKNKYKKQLQRGNDLGEKMMNAFNYAFNYNYSNVVIIGADCAELNATIIDKAFEQLNNYDAIIGPAADGGYYLLGLKKIYEALFTNIKWSTDNVLKTTLQRCKESNLSYFLLEELHDIDEEKDLTYMKHLL